MKTKQSATQAKNVNGKFKRTATALVVAGVIGGISLPVAAGKYRDYSNSAYDYAKVVGVTPVVETFEVNNPVEECWDERVPRQVYHRDHRRHKSHTGEIFGAIIGAAVGNQFGSGRGKKVATAAGAILGGSIARDIKHQNRHNRDYHRDYDRPVAYETVQRCAVRDSYTTEERIVGYDVAYKYRGNVFHTQMNHDPGAKIKVKVTVNPV